MREKQLKKFYVTIDPSERKKKILDNLEEFCKNNSYYLTSAYNVGGGKVQSSSTLIKEASIKDRQSNDELKMFSQKLKALP